MPAQGGKHRATIHVIGRRGVRVHRLHGLGFCAKFQVTVKSSMPPDTVWKKIGDFCGIKSWIPAVSGCVISPDGKQRTVSLKAAGSARYGR